MQNLRLVGLHEDGDHLLLAGSDGYRFQVLINDALRQAVHRDRSHALVDANIPEPDAVQLRPRDIQALLRSGLSREDVAERAGWSVEKVNRYEAPIRAERDYITSLARDIAIHDPSTARGEVVPFGSRVQARLDKSDVTADDIAWDAWRGSKNAWTVQCSFPVGGRLRNATWRFEQASRTLTPTNDEARWFSADEQSQEPLSVAPATRESNVYDVEAEGGLADGGDTTVHRVHSSAASAATVPSHPAGRATKDQPAAEVDDDPVDLMSAMRERSKGRRRRDRDKQETSLPAGAASAMHLNVSDEAPPPTVGSHPWTDNRPVAEATLVTTARPSADELGHDSLAGTVDMFTDVELISSEVPSAGDASQPDGTNFTNNETIVDEPTASKPTDSDYIDERTAKAADATKSDIDEAERTANEDHKDTSDILDDSYHTNMKSVAPPEYSDDVTASERPSIARKGRPAVPSWDDIMFGRQSGRD